MKEGFDGQRMMVLPKVIVEAMEADRACAPLHITDIGQFPKAGGHYICREQPIDRCVFLLCVHGSGWYSVKNKRWPLNSGEFCILPEGIPHAYGASEKNPWSIYWIHYKGNCADLYRTQKNSPGKASVSSDFVHLFEEVYNTLDSGCDIDSLRYSCDLLHHFLGGITYLQSRQSESSAGSDETESRVSSAIRYMEEHLERELNLEQIARSAGYSCSHFSLLFKKYTGHSPISYLNLLRIQKACYLIREHKSKISTVSQQAGFNDPYYFSRTFSKIMGMSPTAYSKIEIK